MKKSFSFLFLSILVFFIFNNSKNIYASTSDENNITFQSNNFDFNQDGTITEISGSISKKTSNKNKGKKSKGFLKNFNANKGALVNIENNMDDESYSASDSSDSNFQKSKKSFSKSLENKVIKANKENIKNSSKKGYIRERYFIPGHETKEMVCQGIAYLPNKVMNAKKQCDGSYCRYVLLSYYPKNSSQPSQLVAIDREKGKAVKRFALYNSMNKKYDGHCGGIAVAGKYLWVASSYKIRAFDLQEIIDFILDKKAKANPSKGLPKSLDKLPVKKLVAVKKYGVDSIASYLSFDGQYLWVGDFVKTSSSKYQPVKHHKIMGRNSWIAGYLVNEKGYPTSKTKYTFNKKHVHEPDAIIATRQSVQGMAICGDYAVLSISFGASKSKLAFYKNPLNSKGEKVTYKADGKSHSVKTWELSSKKNHVKTIKLSAGSEDLEYDGDNLFVTFECSSENYRPRWSRKGKLTEDFYLINPKKVLKKK